MFKMSDWTCPRCGIKTKVDVWPVHCRCGLLVHKETSFPSLTIQAATLVKATTTWIGSGCTTRTKEERASLYSVCQECEQFKSNRCLICGCFLSKKIQLATEHCPIGKW